MAAAALLRMRDRSIGHHFRGYPRTDHPHYRGITTHFTSVTADLADTAVFTDAKHVTTNFQLIG